MRNTLRIPVHACVSALECLRARARGCRAYFSRRLRVVRFAGLGMKSKFAAKSDDSGADRPALILVLGTLAGRFDGCSVSRAGYSAWCTHHQLHARTPAASLNLERAVASRLASAPRTLCVRYGLVGPDDCRGAFLV
jgi:hypothetical protein